MPPRAARLSGMQAHSHPHRNLAWPVAGSKGALSVQAAGNRVPGGLEYNVEAVTLGPHLVAMPRGNRGAQDDALA